VAKKSVVDHLLGVTSHDTLNRCKVLRVDNGRSKLHRNIWSIDVTSVKERLALVTDDD
jgi:hypothetical protein